MAKRSTQHRLCTPPRGLSTYGLSSRAGLNHHRLRRRRWWRTHGMAIIVLIGLPFLAAAVLSQPVPSPGERSPVPQAVHATPVIIVQADTLPPVLHRIAQCESRGEHFTKDGRVVRGKQHTADLGLFQINTVVWGTKAQELGYDLHTREGNTRMARYLFEHYGSVPWQSSAACWNRLS
jgi:hypothetical protein